MLVGRVRRLRRGVPQRLHQRSGFLAGAGAGAAVSVIMVVLCVWLGARPDRRRHRHHAGRRGRDRADLRRPVRREPPDARRHRTRLDTAALRHPGGRRTRLERREPLQPARHRLHRPDPGRRGGLDDAADPPGAQRPGRRRQAGRARRRRGQRAGHAQLGRPLRRAPWRAWAAPTCRSRPRASSRTSSPRGAGFIAIVLAMLARGKALWVLIGVVHLRHLAVALGRAPDRGRRHLHRRRLHCSRSSP